MQVGDEGILICIRPFRHSAFLNKSDLSSSSLGRFKQIALQWNTAHVSLNFCVLEKIIHLQPTIEITVINFTINIPTNVACLNLLEKINTLCTKFGIWTTSYIYLMVPMFGQSLDMHPPRSQRRHPGPPDPILGRLVIITHHNSSFSPWSHSVSSSEDTSVNRRSQSQPTSSWEREREREREIKRERNRERKKKRERERERESSIW